jgi:hypothetical protein
MAYAPKLREFLKEAERNVDARRKNIESLQNRIKSNLGNPNYDLLNLVFMETLENNEAHLALLILHVGLADHVDKVNDAMNSIQRKLEETGISKTKILEIEELTKKHDEIYQAIDKMIQRSADMVKREASYVQ